MIQSINNGRGQDNSHSASASHILCHSSNWPPISALELPDHTCCAAPCCVQVSSSDKPGFVLHMMPVHPDLVRKNNLCQPVSRAGDGPGLQVFSGSVQEVAQVRGGELLTRVG
jgi:hypothetical protein